jgi:hypothetical protein
MSHIKKLQSSGTPICPQVKCDIKYKYLFVLYEHEALKIRWCLWFGHCATSRKVAGSIPDGVTGIFWPHFGPEVDSTSDINEFQELPEG